MGVGMRVYNEDGSARTGEILVNTTTAHHEWWPETTHLDNGGFVIVWNATGQDGSGKAVMMQRFDANGNKVGSETQVNTNAAGNQDLAHVETLTNGDYVVTWSTSNGNGIAAQRFTEDGVKVGGEIAVNTLSGESSLWKHFPEVAPLDDGGFIIVYQTGTGGSAAVYAQRFDANNNKVGEETRISEDYTVTSTWSGLHPSVTNLADGGYVIGWNAHGVSGDEVFQKRFNADGSEYKKSFHLNLVDESDSGTNNYDDITNDDTPTFDGIGEPGATVTIYNGAVAVGTATVGANGKWEITTSVLAEGEHTLRAVIKDTAGNSKEATLDVEIDKGTEIGFGVDGSAPATHTDDTTPTIEGTGEVGATVKLYDGATLVGTAIVNEEGKWSITTTELSKGSHTLRAEITDLADNKAESSFDLRVGKYEVNVEVGTMYSHAAGFIISGNAYNPGAFPTPDMVYTDAPAGTKVTLEITFTVSGYGTFTMSPFDVTVDANGNYRFTQIAEAPGTNYNPGITGSIPNSAWNHLGAVADAIGCGKPMTNISIKGYIGDINDPDSNIDTDSVIGRGSPLVLDLDDDGVETIGVEQGVTFDIDGDGIKDKTGWVGKDDGLLVRDINGDGQINDAKELFGEETIKSDGTKARDGFDALADLDSNGDGVVNSQDEAFNELKVWKDSNSDGITQDGELLSLEEAGVSEISVSSEQTSTIDESGNKIGLEGSYKDENGKEKDIADVWFSYESGYEADETVDLEDFKSKVKDNTVDITNNKATALHIDFDDILDITDENNELKILGDEDGNPDKVILDSSAQWTANGQETVDDITYNVYKGTGSTSVVKLLIEDDIIIDI